MKIVHLTPGTGNFHCGSCHRDNHLVKALRQLGHDVVMVPLYLPLVTDGPPASGDTPMFVGGINLFLQQKLPWFRHTPRWLDRLLDAPALLLAAVKRAHMTSAKDLGAMTVASLQGTLGPQAKEWQRLLTWIQEVEKPDLISLSNGLLNGLAPAIQRELRVPVVCSLQGEDSFIDTLPEPYRSQAWQALRDNSTAVAHYVATSIWYAEQMRTRLQLDPSQITAVPNGLDLTGYAPAAEPPRQRTIGFLARMIAGKGLGDLVSAFIDLKQRPGSAPLQLALGGTMTDGDQPFINLQKQRLAEAGLTPHVRWAPNLTAAEKISFYQSLTVLSVPATYGEAFGLYVLESLACGVPVVEPDHAGLGELVRATGGGLLYEPTDPQGLTNALATLLGDAPQRHALATTGRAKVLEKYCAQAMAQAFAQVAEAVLCAA